jgi:hypothetical protein
MSNGNAPEVLDVAPATSVAFDLSKLSYGDLRRLQSLGTMTPEAGQVALDSMLDKVVVGGLDAIPIVEFNATIVALKAEIDAAMSGKNELAAPS